jgi:hypothetical protein
LSCIIKRNCSDIFSDKEMGVQRNISKFRNGQYQPFCKQTRDQYIGLRYSANWYYIPVFITYLKLTPDSICLFIGNRIAQNLFYFPIAKISERNEHDNFGLYQH